MNVAIIQNKIYDVRGQRVMSDCDPCRIVPNRNQVFKTCRKAKFEAISGRFYVLTDEGRV